MGTRSTVTGVNTIRRWTRTSLRPKGEVQPAERSAGAACAPCHGGARAVSGVVGDSRSGRGGVREGGNGSAADIACPKGSPQGERSEANLPGRDTGNGARQKSAWPP